MKTFCTILLSLVLLSPVWATTPYDYTLDLTHVKDDKVQVTLMTPTIKKSETRFHFPKVIPGSYTVYNFGRFISDFKAFDKNDNLLPATRGDINTFIIKDAKKLTKITYWVDDSFDHTSGVPVYGMSGTNIEEDRGFVINGHGFFGYFEGMKKSPFNVTVKKPNHFFGASALPKLTTNKHQDVYHAPSYNYLVDMPMLYSEPDTTSIRVAESDVLVAVNSPSDNVQSSYLAKHLKDILLAEKEYMGGQLPVDRYAFLMHFLNQGEQVGTGALEHNYSSLYVLPDIPQENFIQQIKDIAAHEFFHIITPLNVHSNEIHNFDFADPKMSRHLWMYEGVTEYFSHHAQLVANLTDLDHFMNVMAQKSSTALQNFDDELPFTKLSTGCLDEHHDQYANVYMKGALIGFCLDVVLRKSTDGQMGMIDLMNKLMHKFGNTRPFSDRKLFREIKRLSTPEAKRFLKKYVNGKDPLPLKEMFADIGYEYKAPQTQMGFTYGRISLDYNSETNRILITSVAQLNSFGKKMGYQSGDQIISINGQTPDTQNPFSIFTQEREKFVVGELLTIVVSRNDQETTLKAPIEKVEQPGQATIVAFEDLTPTQSKLRTSWLQGAKKKQP